MADDPDQDLADLTIEIRNSDIALELAKEIRQREALEVLVISLLDRIAMLETKAQLHECYHDRIV